MKKRGKDPVSNKKASDKRAGQPTETLDKAVKTASKAAAGYISIKKAGGIGPAAFQRAKKKISSVPSKNWVYFGGGLLTLDQIAKLGVRKHLKPGESFSLGPFIIRNSPNRGAAFRWGEDYSDEIRILSTSVTAALGTALCFSVSDERYRACVPPLSLLFHGALSNVMDRLNFDEVTDYLSFQVKNRKGQAMTFNLGDFAIFAGAAWLTGVWAANVDKADR